MKWLIRALLVTTFLLAIPVCTGRISPPPSAVETANRSVSSTEERVETSRRDVSTYPKTPTTTSEATSDPDVSTDLETSSRSNGPPPATYRLTAILDYDRHHLSVEEQIEYINLSPEALSNMVLIVEPTRYPETFRLNSLTWGDGQPVTDYNQDLGQLRIPLPQLLPPGERIVLTLDYELNLPSPDSTFYGRPIPFGYTSRQTNLVDWYPYLPPYIPGQGWLVHQAGAFGEYLVYDMAEFEVNIRLEGSREDIIIAASAPGYFDGRWHRYRHAPARNFAWSASPTYEVTTEQVGDVSVVGYAFPVHGRAGRAALKTTAAALALYSEIFGPYPHKSLTVVEADFLDGMEYDGMYFLSRGFYNLYSGTPGEYLVAIAAHETAHQWWYALVANDQALEPWLDEALCTYSERLFYERLHPEGLDWWWQYRVKYYQPHGWVDGSIYNPEGYRAYRDAVYLNGAMFLEDLRKLTGDEAFFAFLKDYLVRNSRRIASIGDFFAVLEDHTQADLTPLLDQYFSKKTFRSLWKLTW